MTDKIKPEADLAQYVDGAWHGLPLYRSPFRREYATISAPEFRAHLRQATPKPPRPHPEPPTKLDRFGNPVGVKQEASEPPAKRSAKKSK